MKKHLFTSDFSEMKSFDCCSSWEKHPILFVQRAVWQKAWKQKGATQRNNVGRGKNVPKCIDFQFNFWNQGLQNPALIYNPTSGHPKPWVADASTLHFPKITSLVYLSLMSSGFFSNAKGLLSKELHMWCKTGAKEIQIKVFRTLCSL